MADWLSTMQQTFEYYTVDPNTWKDVDKLTNVKSCTITRDLDVATLGSATIDITESIGESYVRVYLITIQNGVTERHPLGTFLVQTPASSFNGKVRNVTMDAYTPLLELKENPPPLGYSLLKDENIMSKAYRLVRENVRAPVVEAKCDKTLNNDFVSAPEDTWITFVSDLIANAKYRFELDELGRILFAPNQDIASLQPVWTYDDSEQSILYHDISLDHDLYGIPNVVEVICSSRTALNTENTEIYYSRIVNDDSNSPVSTVNRGREIVHRVTDPGFVASPTEKQVELYAKQLLKELSSIEYTISYTHGYCGTRLGDCIRLNYSRAGLMGIKAKIISQSIKCVPGCPVTEKAVFTNKLWG